MLSWYPSNQEAPPAEVLVDDRSGVLIAVSIHVALQEVECRKHRRKRPTQLVHDGRNEEDFALVPMLGCQETRAQTEDVGPTQFDVFGGGHWFYSMARKSTEPVLGCRSA